ncbi:unnamed protein product [Parnassius apollo]|uniref:(apollo) hypothetical protein n=1 Tax=Parnassius apollo TaxID=110799 RepID=A0A8S3W0A8_PARAO|nr:unnamed protein product [Parnassius apollo]
MPFKKVMKGIPLRNLPAEGVLKNDREALTSYQQECVTRLGMTIQMEQEAYLNMHPEIQAMLTSFIAKMIHTEKRRDILKEAAEHFTRPYDILHKEIRDKLRSPADGSYKQKYKAKFESKEFELMKDFDEIYSKYYHPKTMPILASNSSSTSNTLSSSFVSIVTSDTTLPTPEPVPTPEPTLSENMLTLIYNTVDKAVFQHVDDDALRYDTAYVELSKAVETAMEIPVIEIKEDIAELFYKTYRSFEIDIMAKERIAAEKAWERRMRKKLKRTLRRMNNFKGYETPPTPKSEPSSHESYKIPPPRPCECHPQFKYNRYPKDRFGIYLPRETQYSDKNVTLTPAVSTESVDEETADEKIDLKSVISRKSAVSSKSSGSKKYVTVENRNEMKAESIN